jgi:hypothetical protein
VRRELTRRGDADPQAVGELDLRAEREPDERRDGSVGPARAE